MRKLFKDSHPILFAELHPNKNQDVDFSKIYENSGKKVWWQCKKNPRHVWPQSVTARVRSGYGCSYCSKRYTLPEDSFASLFPNILKELHPTKNIDFDPYTVSPNSDKKICWLCPKGHEWETTIWNRTKRHRKCPVCKKIDGSLATKYPEIAKEWHPTKNLPLTPLEITPSYDKQVWWCCGAGHEWQVRVCSRVFSKSMCKECSRKRSSINRPLPVLSIHNPVLASQWHPSKNGTLKPSDITAGSNQKVWWLCPTNPNHEWPATVNNRVRGKSCPYCSNNEVDVENSLAIRFPEIAKQWHPIKNGDYKPTDFSYGSSFRAWWQCLDDSSHEWPSTITNRTQKNKKECPSCIKSQFADTNTLLAVHPEIAEQWHPTKNNQLKPSNVSRASRRKVWWQCPVNPSHEWDAQIKNRTLLGGGCPDCAKEKNIIRMTEHLYDIDHVNIDCYHIFLSNMRVLQNLAEHSPQGKPRLIQPYYRMVFASVVTSFEVYLADAYCKAVLNDDTLIETYVSKNPEFSKKQYSLTEVIEWNKNLKKKVSEYLNNIIWHNLSTVKNMYSDVLGVTFPEDIIDIYKAIAIRHDLVHRNGKQKSGTIHKIEKSQILDLIKDIKEFVLHINEQLENVSQE